MQNRSHTLSESEYMSRIRENIEDKEQKLTHHIHRYRHGDKEAFTEIFDQYFPRLYRFLAIFTNNSPCIEDILQDTFLKVALHLNTLKDDKRFKEWIFTICHNTAINYKKRENMEMWHAMAYNIGEEDSPEQNVIKEEQEKMVREALSCLTEDQKSVIILSRYEGMNYTEIANIMGRKENAVKALAHRAMTRLGEFLERTNRNEL